MYNPIGALLSDELFAQAVRVDGILYLPAYDLVKELVILALPVSLLLITVFLLAGLSLVLLVLQFRKHKNPRA